LLADSAGSLKRPDGTLRNDPTKYRDTLAALRGIPACIGFHLFEAYLRNHVRNRGLRGPDETPDRDAIAGITAANHDMAAWAKELVAEGSSRM
jgi:hypothetical protein